MYAGFTTINRSPSRRVTPSSRTALPTSNPRILLRPVNTANAVPVPSSTATRNIGRPSAAERCWLRISPPNRAGRRGTTSAIELTSTPANRPCNRCASNSATDSDNRTLNDRSLATTPTIATPTNSRREPRRPPCSSMIGALP